jgi:hypothetical protein
MVLRYAHLTPEKLSSVAARNSTYREGAALRNRSKNRYVFATFRQLSLGDGA